MIELAKSGLLANLQFVFTVDVMFGFRLDEKSRCEMIAQCVMKSQAESVDAIISRAIDGGFSFADE